MRVIKRFLNLALPGSRCPSVDLVKAKGGEQVWVGLPANPPCEVVAILQRRLKEIPSVRAAYLAQIWTDTMGDEPELAVAVQTESSVVEVAEACTNVLAKEMVDPPTINYTDVRSTLGASIREKARPFFTRG